MEVTKYKIIAFSSKVARSSSKGIWFADINTEMTIRQTYKTEK